jgi:hypothetical protein
MDSLTFRELALAAYRFRHPPQEDLALFETVRATATKAVGSWKDSLVLVCLPLTGNIVPSLVRMASAKEFSKRDREQVLRICSTLPIPDLDVEKCFAAEASKSNPPRL